MKGIIIYLFSFLVLLIALVYALLGDYLPQWLINYQLIFLCSICGGFGGVLYCLRGVYLNYSVKKNWSPEWYPWYIIRPVVSMMTGSVSFLFLKAGLIVLESKTNIDSTNLGFYALAFISGLNVDKFISKIEDLAQATWGIEKSRTSDDKK